MKQSEQAALHSESEQSEQDDEGLTTMKPKQIDEIDITNTEKNIQKEMAGKVNTLKLHESSQSTSLTDFVVFDVTTPNPNNKLRRKYAEKITEFKSWVNGQNNLDFYQFMAVRVGTQTVSILDYYRAVALMVLQECAVLYVLHGQGRFLSSTMCHDEITKGWCSGDGRSKPRQLATVLSIFVSFLFYNEMLNLRMRGLYSWKGMEQPCFVNKFWIALGLLLNVIVTISGWIASLFLVYLSEYPLEMVLNAVALYFVVDLDNEAVYFGDYKKLANWIELEYDDFIDRHYESESTETRGRCDRISDFIIKMAHFIGCRDYNVFYLLPIAFISPIYMMICY